MIAPSELTKADVIRLLHATGELQQELFEQARAVRSQCGADEVTLRGVIEFSNYCQKGCEYCAMRHQNHALDRYRMSAEDILDIFGEVRQYGIGIAFLQAGQDPQSDKILEQVIPVLRREMGMSVLLCVGERKREVYHRFAELGADSYILKFESSDPAFYKQIAYTSLAKRLECMNWIREAGMKLGTGNIVGLPGQTVDTLVEDYFLGVATQPDFVSSSPFIPNQNTPFELGTFGNVDVTLNTMALWRIALGSPLIPTVSALERIRPDGQYQGFMAGANVMTINFTPQDFRDKYMIYSKQRFIVSLDHAMQTLDRAGLTIKSPVLTPS